MAKDNSAPPERVERIEEGHEFRFAADPYRYQDEIGGRLIYLRSRSKLSKEGLEKLVCHEKG